MKNSTKFITKGIAILLAMGMPLSQAGPMLFAAQSNQPNTVQETVNVTKTYDEVFKIPSSAIKSITNNAKHYGNSTIDKAIDGKNSTHFETNKPNSDSFHNMVTVTFDDNYEISKVNYLVRQDGAKPKGFPLEYVLYYSTSETGDDFKELKTGSFNSATGSTVSIEFEPTEMRRFRFEFVKAKDNWASMAEISFYKYDDVEKEMEKVFTDRTYSKLSDEYKNAAKLNQLINKVQDHPNLVKYQRLLDDAKILLENENAFENTTFTASQRGNVNKEAQRTKIWGHMYGDDPTGYYVTPGETIYVYVEADQKGIMPNLAFGQIGDDRNGWRRSFNLKPGMNEITAQSFDKMRPAAIYISNQALPADQAYAPKVRIVGGTKFPMYVHGKTDTETFKQELDEYMKNVSFNDEDFDNGNPNGYYYNIAEITSENVIISTSAAGAYKEVNNIIKSGKSVEYYMDAWEDMYYSYAVYSGFNIDNPDDPNYMPRGKFNSRIFTKGPYGWADYGYTGYNGGNTKRRDGEFFSTLIKAPTSGGWALYHEWGHVYDSNRLGRGESTNNLYSLLMQDKYTDRNRMVKDNRWNDHFTKYHNTKQYPNDQLFYGAIVYQLQGVFGEDIYGKASKLARENTDGIMTGLNKNNDRLAVALSFAIGQDVTGHFDYYGETTTDLAKQKTASLPKCELKTWYVNDKTFAKDAKAFDNAEVVPVVSVSGSKKAELTMSIDEDANALLNYEIYRDGKYIGVTYNNKFVDNNVEANRSYTYTVIAYDRKLNPSNVSETVTYNPSKPVINVKDNLILPLYSTFDVLNGVSAKTVDGDDITNSLEVISNNVDTLKKGNYEVIYQVIDQDGNKSQKIVQVSVVAGIEYASDLQWQSATTQYRTVNKDKGVNNEGLALNNGSEDTAYDKGISAHANSTVVYNIEGKGYSSFESYIGVNQGNVKNKGSVTFEIWLDGQKVYDSGVIKGTDNQKYVSVPLNDAKEITLITTDAGDGNGADHSTWADAKFIIDDAIPQISANAIAVEEGEAVDLLANVTASDIEDGDLTSQITVETDYHQGLSGTFDVTYKVSDNDGNFASKTVKLIVANTSNYLSDKNWVSAKAGWGSVQKDKSIGNNKIRLKGENGIVTYEKGLGTHATSTIIYDLTDKDYAFFTSYVGVDQEIGNPASVAFKVYVDGVLKAETGVMKKADGQEFIKVNIAGAKELKLVVSDGGNGIGSDHADWADAKLWTGEKQIDTSQYDVILKTIDNLKEMDYTSNSWQDLLEAKNKAQEAMLISQEQFNQATVELQNAVTNLVEAANLDIFKTTLNFAQQITDTSFVLSQNHQDIRLYNLNVYIDKALKLLDEMKTTRNTPQSEIDRINYMLVYSIEECGQIYIPNGNPIKK